MSAAFEAALDKLGLVDRSNPATHEVAKLSSQNRANAALSGCALWHCGD
jgi:hypothetical protein